MNIAIISKEFCAALLKGGFITAGSIEALFETHPDTEVFFITSDGQAFFEQTMADAHGQKLVPRDVLMLTRADVADLDAATFADGLGEVITAQAEPGETNPGPGDTGGDNEPAADQPTGDTGGDKEPAAEPAPTPPAAEPTYAELKETYKALTGKNVGVGMSAEKLKVAIAEAQTQKAANPQA